MIFKSILLTTAIIGGIFLTIISLSLAITKRDRKSKKNWGVIFGVSMVLTIGLTAYTVIKVINHAEAFWDNTAEALAETMNDDREDVLVNNEYIALLKSYTPDSLKGKEPNGFYTYFGFRDWYRFPLVYPYSLNCIDGTEYGHIYNEINAVDIEHNHDGVIQLYVNNITAFSLDRNILLAKTSSPHYENDPPEYLVFYFATQKVENFDTQEALMKRANEMSYSGPDTLMTIDEYNALF